MTVEAVTYISDLNASYPAAGDGLVEGDDHIRNLKTGIKATFPNISAAVTPTHTEINYVDGVTSAIQTQLNGKALVLLTLATASASATLDFTTLIDSTYRDYELHGVDMVPSANAQFDFYTSANAGSSWDSAAGDYDYVASRQSGTTTTVTNGSTTATAIRLAAGVNIESTTAWGGFSFVIRISNPAGTAHHKRIVWIGGAPANTTKGNLAIIKGSGTRAATAAINGFRVAPSAGNIATGYVALYGVKQ
jgi:hypothetical protein